MKAVIALLFLISSSAVLAHRHNLHLVELFESWKISHGKQYSSALEEASKFETFTENYQKIQEWNAENNGVTLGLTQFADLTPEEFSATIQCLSEQSVSEVQKLPTAPLDTTNLPSSVNWTAAGAVTSVKNQGQCGGCWAFAAAASLESYNFLKNGQLEDFSEQQLIDCVSTCHGCDGCDNLYNALNYTVTYGIEFLVDYPFTGTTGKCTYQANDVATHNQGYYNVETNSESSLMAAIAQQPTIVGIQANQLVFQLYKGGVISSLCGDKVDHAVTAVGYGNIDGKMAFIIKNSWGATWGDQGYVYIGMDSTANSGSGVCGIYSSPCYPTNIEK